MVFGHDFWLEPVLLRANPDPYRINLMAEIAVPQ
jgi:hypothetical protein